LCPTGVSAVQCSARVQKCAFDRMNEDAGVLLHPPPGQGMPCSFPSIPCHPTLHLPALTPADMFHSQHEQGLLHATARAVSGEAPWPLRHGHYAAVSCACCACLHRHPLYAALPRIAPPAALYAMFLCFCRWPSVRLRPPRAPQLRAAAPPGAARRLGAALPPAGAPHRRLPVC
jgi:hypothetical protein